MVHYIFTPWRDRRELLAVRQQFYPRGAASFAAVFTGTDAPESNAIRREAVARVTIWMQRGFCPHMVESTALLTAAILGDSSPVAARAAYAAAFARFVTGLLDGQQDRARKMSMHGLAQHIGLPAGFVELRHQVTHEALPSLRRLRSASQQALAWIYDYYWAGVGDGTNLSGAENEMETAEPGSVSLNKVLRRYIASDSLLPSACIARWGEVRLLSELAKLSKLADSELEAHLQLESDDTTAETRARIRQLSQAVLQYGSTGQTLQLGETGTAQPVSRKRPRTEKPATPAAVAVTVSNSAPAPVSVLAPAITAPKTWTAANLNLVAMRASMARNREALSNLNTEKSIEKVEDKKEDKDEMDVDEAETKEDEKAEEAEASDGDEEVPAKQPRWTRITGTWTPKPIGVA